MVEVKEKDISLYLGPLLETLEYNFKEFILHASNKCVSPYMWNLKQNQNHR